MKWPKQMVFVRHAQSEYNVLRVRKEADSKYNRFKQLFNRLGKSSFTELERRELLYLAQYVEDTYSLGCSDRETSITGTGKDMAYNTGMRLKNEIEFPDVVFVSPYDRTVQTWEEIKRAWPELEQVPVYYDERIRELDHGLSLLYNDWRVYHTYHPDQKRLRDLLGLYDYRYLNGENVPDVRMRVRDWRGTVIREFHDKNVLVITHHLTLLAWRADQERWSPKEFIRMDEHEKPINCGVTIYDGVPGEGSAGRLVLSRYNHKLY